MCYLQLLHNQMLILGAYFWFAFKAVTYASLLVSLKQLYLNVRTPEPAKLIELVARNQPLIWAFIERFIQPKEY